MATVNLRLSGVTPLQLAVSAVAAFPFGYTAVEFVRHPGAISPTLLALAGAAALLPWLSRAAARASYRAKCDEVAVHVRGEALPYRTITEVSLEKSARRTVLRLKRGVTVELHLVLSDAFAGRLQPIEALSRRLAEHGHPIPKG